MNNIKYIPKVGDIIKSKTQNNTEYKIMSIVGEHLTYIYTTNNWATHNANPLVTKANMFNDVTKFVCPKEKFIPKKGDNYYFPVLDSELGYGVSVWNCGKVGCNREQILLDKGLVFKTSEEAVEWCENATKNK